MKSQFREVACPENCQGTVIAIPGGPGLSCATLPLDCLYQDFRVLLLDPPGCGAAPQPDFDRLSADRAYRQVVQSLADEIQQGTGPSEAILLLGHSYGGIMAADCLPLLTDRPRLGLALMASPFTQHLFCHVLQQQIKVHGDPGFFESREAYFRDPSLETYRVYARSYGRLLSACDPRSLGMIQTLFSGDRPSPLLNARCAKSFRQDTGYERRLQEFTGPMMALAGVEDLLLPLDEMVPECRRLGIQLRPVLDAGHFPHLDSPDQIRQCLLDLARLVRSGSCLERVSSRNGHPRGPDDHAREMTPPYNPINHTAPRC